MVYKKSWKYILIKDNSCYRPKAIKDFYNVSKGDLGGYVEGYHNLSQKGDCWIYDYSIVFGNAKVSGNAQVYGNSKVFSDAKIFGNARVKNFVQIFGVSEISGEDFNTKENFFIKVIKWFIKNLGNIS
jgi:lipoate-protein ligase A